LLERAVRTTLRHEGVSGGEISITFLPDGAIRDLNRRWLGHDRVTDVLSFGLHDSGEPPIGDIYVGIEQAARQARDERVPLREELCRLSIHGTLHVLGYDHDGDRGPISPHADMYERQESLLALTLAKGGREASGRPPSSGGGP
jgi:probable rRNA maturation factor